MPTTPHVERFAGITSSHIVTVSSDEGDTVTAGYIGPSASEPGHFWAGFINAEGDRQYIRGTKPASLDAAARKIIDRYEQDRHDAQELELYATNTGELYDERLSIIRRSLRDKLANNPELKDFPVALRRYRTWMLDAANRYQWEIERHPFSASARHAAARSVFEIDIAAVRNGEWNEPAAG